MNHLPVSQDVDEIPGVDANNRAIPVTGNNSTQIKSKLPPGDSVKDTVTRVIQEEDIVYQFKIGLVLEDIVLTSQRLRLSYCTNAVIRNVTVNASYWGIIIDNSNGILIENCTVIDGIASTDTTDITIKECTIKESEQYYGNIGVEGCDGVSVKNNTLYTTVIAVSDSTNIHIEDNNFLAGKSSSNMIDIYRCDNIVVSNNMMVPATGGIYVFRSNHVNVTVNTVDKSSITIEGSTRVTISNNVLSNTGSAAIYTMHNSRLNITDNTITNSISGITVYANNYTSITGNELYKLETFAFNCMNCKDLLFESNTINKTGNALRFTNGSIQLSKNIEITGNHYWNVMKNFSYLSGEVTFGPGYLYIHDNYLNGLLFDGIPGITTTTTTTTIMTSTSTTETVAVPVVPLLLAIAGKTIHMMIRRRRYRTRIGKDSYCC